MIYYFLAQVPTVDPAKMMPSADQIAGWSASQTIQWLLVIVLIASGFAAYFGMRALSKSNEAVNSNYDKTLNMWQQRFEIQDTRHDAMLKMWQERYQIQDQRYDKQEIRHQERDNETHEVLKNVAVTLQSISEKLSRHNGGT